jgi:hypothetical protein
LESIPGLLTVREGGGGIGTLLITYIVSIHKTRHPTKWEERYDIKGETLDKEEGRCEE